MGSSKDALGAVVLNYNDYKSTISCVTSLIACVPPPGHIVVVDNDSPNESMVKLTEALYQSDNLEIINSEFNGGYSFGNNVGIRRLRRLGYKHVVIATSDTVARSPDLFARLSEAIESSAGMVAPQIMGPDGHENPSKEQLDLKYLLDLTWIRYGMPGLEIRKMATRIFRTIFASADRQRGSQAARSRRDECAVRRVYKLHGAFVCLTESFFKRAGMLDERIFMFGEEDLLAWKCLEHGLDQLLVESVLVHHAHDSSVNMTWGRRGQEFVVKEQRRSGKVLRNEIVMRKLVLAWFDRLTILKGRKPG